MGLLPEIIVTVIFIFLWPYTVVTRTAAGLINTAPNSPPRENVEVMRSLLGVGALAGGGGGSARGIVGVYSAMVYLIAV